MSNDARTTRTLVLHPSVGSSAKTPRKYSTGAASGGVFVFKRENSPARRIKYSPAECKNFAIVLFLKKVFLSMILKSLLRRRFVNLHVYSTSIQQPLPTFTNIFHLSAYCPSTISGLAMILWWSGDEASLGFLVMIWR